jgi:hypothetical protein
MQNGRLRQADGPGPGMAAATHASGGRQHANATNLDALDVPAQVHQRREILAHADIKALAARFPERQAQLRACIDGLIGEGPAETDTLVMATKKAFETITGKLRVFLS